jgi:sortase A
VNSLEPGALRYSGLFFSAPMKTLGNMFAAVGLLALGYWTFQHARTRLYQGREMQRFAGERRPVQRPPDMASKSKAPTLRERPYPSIGSVVAMLEIPRLGLSTVVVEGSGERELTLGPGHIPGTSFPGEGGNVGVAGHRDTFFRPLRRIRRDDTIQMIDHEREYRYKVVSTEIVGPDDVHVLYPGGHETLTLVTCYPFDFVGAAPKRFIVRAGCANCPGRSD